MTAPDTAAPTTGGGPLVIGLDLSLTRSGVASCRGWCDNIKPHASVRGLKRLRYVLRRVDYHLPDGVALAVMEGPSYGHGAMAGHDELAALRWMVRDLADRRGVPLAIAPPSSVKLWATGKGNADKAAVIGAMNTRYPGALITGSDEADALALATMGNAWLDTWCQSPTEQRALAGVAWPDQEVTAR